MTVDQLLDFIGIRYLWSKLGPFISSTYATKDELEAVRETATTAYHYKGTVSEVSDLPSTGNEVGDVYNVSDSLDGGNYAWTGEEWDKLGDTYDLSVYALDADVVHLAGDESISGTKTFSSPIVGDLDGTADMALKDGDGNVITATYATQDLATDQVSGLMSAADKEKLDGIQSGANIYTLPQAAYGTLGGVTTTSQIVDTSRLTPCPIVSGVVYYDNDPETSAITAEQIDALFAA